MFKNGGFRTKGEVAGKCVHLMQFHNQPRPTGGQILSKKATNHPQRMIIGMGYQGNKDSPIHSLTFYVFLLVVQSGSRYFPADFLKLDTF
jgi:hypothetical protein